MIDTNLVIGSVALAAAIVGYAETRLRMSNLSNRVRAEVVADAKLAAAQLLADAVIAAAQIKAAAKVAKEE